MKDKERKEIKEMISYEEKLSALHNLSKEIALTLDKTKICRAVLDAAEKTLNFGNIDLFLVDEKAQELHLFECRGLKDPEMKTVIPLDSVKGITVHVARTQRSLNIGDVRKDRRHIPGLKNARSELCVPLKIMNRTIGLLDAESRELNAFSEGDQTLLEILAFYASIALETAELFEEQRGMQEIYKTLVDTSPEAITATDLEGEIIFVSPHALEMHGTRNVQDLLGKSAFELIAPEDRERAKDGLQDTLTMGSVRDLEYTFLRKDGSHFIGELNASVIKNSNGDPVGFIATTRDVTDRKKAEEELRASERKLREFFENVLEGIYQTTPDGRLLFANPALVQMLGYESEAELLGLNIATDLYVDPIQRENIVKRLEKEGFVRNVELVLRCKNGHQITVLESGRVALDENSRVKFFEGILNDITELKRAEKQLRSLFEASKLLNSSIDIQEIYKFVSDSVKDLIGFDNFVIFLLSEDEERIYPAYVSEGLRDAMKTATLGSGEGLVGHCIKNGSILLLDNADKDERGVWIPGTEVCISQILVPLMVEGKCVGALHISKSVENAYDQKDIEVLKPLSEVISSAVRNSRLFDEVKSLNRELERRIEKRSRRLEILLETRQNLQSERNWERGMHTIVESVVRLGFDRSGIALVNSTRGTLEYYLGKGTQLPAKGISVPLSDPDYVAVKCVREKRTIYVEKYTPDEGKQITSESESFIWVPIVVQDEAFAALGADNVETKRRIDEDDIKDVEILASMSSALIDRTRILVEPVAENHLKTKKTRMVENSESYIVLEPKPQKSLEIFVELVTHGVPGFIISREHPDKLRRAYGLTKTPIFWLSQAEDSNAMSPNDLSKLNYILRGFVERTEESVILFDGAEYLATQTSFETLLKYLQALKDIIVTRNSILIVPLFRDTLSHVEFSRLEREFVVL
ncbi:MAG: PAS domain S-box protein [Theionarchaea archaeon]|nr:PAS domain S-box protein [Theionarchaea archaeon]MBU7036552.1 PAS domain S-box protein [Theionarchaea archaeon]